MCKVWNLNKLLLMMNLRLWWWNRNLKLITNNIQIQLVQDEINNNNNHKLKIKRTWANLKKNLLPNLKCTKKLKLQWAVTPNIKYKRNNQLRHNRKWVKNQCLLNNLKKQRRLRNKNRWKIRLTKNKKRLKLLLPLRLKTKMLIWKI